MYVITCEVLLVLNLELDAKLPNEKVTRGQALDCQTTKFGSVFYYSSIYLHV